MMSKIKKWYDIPSWIEKDRCPMCNKKLVKKHEGIACVGACPLNFKLGKGWVYLNRKKEKSVLFWTSKYDFDITSFENRKKWLTLKSEMIYEKGCCEICREPRLLHVHHILHRSSNPELALDKENLMILCKSCHQKIHENDKHRFGGKL